jgi:lipooligosaccharide transport system permease protein
MQKVAWFSPLYHLVNITRVLVSGNVGIYIAADITRFLIAALLILPAPIYLLRRLIIR